MKTYLPVVCTDWVIDGGTATKAPQVILSLKVVRGPEAGQLKRYYASLHENAAEFTMTALRCLGWTGNDITDLTGLGTIEATAVEDDDNWNGKSQRKIKFINPAGGPKLKATNPVPKDLGVKFKAMAASIKVDVSASPKAPSKEELANLAPTETVTTEESPF